MYTTSGKCETNLFHIFDVIRLTKKISMLFLELLSPNNYTLHLKEFI